MLWYLEKIKGVIWRHMARFPERWGDMTSEDTEMLRDWEREMIDIFPVRNLTELDKRCFMVDQGMATLKGIAESRRLRDGELIEVIWIESDHE